VSVKFFSFGDEIRLSSKLKNIINNNRVLLMMLMFTAQKSKIFAP